MPAYRRALGARVSAPRRGGGRPQPGPHPPPPRGEGRLRGPSPLRLFGESGPEPGPPFFFLDLVAPPGLQRPPVGPERVSFLNDPVTVAERTFPDDMEIGKGLNHRLKACTDCLAAFRWLYVLRVALNDRRKVEAEEALHVVIVESLVPRIQQTDVICHTHLDSPPPLREGPGYSKRAPPRLPSRSRMAARADRHFPASFRWRGPMCTLDRPPPSDRKPANVSHNERARGKVVDRSDAPAPLRPLPASRVRWECCDPGTLFPRCLSQAWTTTCHGRLGPPEPASPPRSHPALAHHRGDALRILAAAGVVESDHPAAPHLAVRRRRPRHARDRRPMEDRMAEHPAPRRGVRDHRRRPRGEVVLRPGLDGPRDARLVRSVARRELGVGRLADDLPCGRQHRDSDLPHSRSGNRNDPPCGTATPNGSG